MRSPSVTVGRRSLRAALLLVALAWTSTGEAQLTVKPLAYFGDDEGVPARGKLPADAGMLSSVGLVREVGNEGVAVYDYKMKRIVVFDRSGRVSRHIGRAGKGPGEFTNVLSMDYDRGRLAVFDYSLSRVTIFDTSGTLLRTTRTALANHILLRGDTIWGAARGARKNALWKQHIGSDASQRVDFLPVDTPNPNFNPPGQGFYYVLGKDADGGALIAHDVPGLWFSEGPSGLTRQMGRELLPGAKYFVNEGVAQSPGQIDGIIGLGKDRVGLLLLRFEKDHRRVSLEVHAASLSTRVPVIL
ncbi:MAG: 6-bladed beta-propeller [Gemmatimonadaceae bacterium]|jgi:hypothetical protein|nr:6-bladed beta-propeller [Gemmatimonadaceae bacterium]